MGGVMSQKVLRFGWEYHKNESRACMHCDAKLFRRHSYTLSSDKQPTADQAALYEAISAIPGVLEVSISNYRVSIQRGAVFQWDEIRSEVERLVMEFAGAESLEDCQATMASCSL